MYLHLMRPGEGGRGRLQGSRLLAALCCCPEGVSEGTKVLRPAALAPLHWHFPFTAPRCLPAYMQLPPFVKPHSLSNTTSKPRCCYSHANASNYTRNSLRVSSSAWLGCTPAQLWWHTAVVWRCACWQSCCALGRRLQIAARSPRPRCTASSQPPAPVDLVAHQHPRAACGGCAATAQPEWPRSCAMRGPCSPPSAWTSRG
jgi:hypothetical protein